MKYAALFSILLSTASLLGMDPSLPTGSGSAPTPLDQVTQTVNQVQTTVQNLNTQVATATTSALGIRQLLKDNDFFFYRLLKLDTRSSIIRGFLTLAVGKIIFGSGKAVASIAQSRGAPEYIAKIIQNGTARPLGIIPMLYAGVAFAVATASIATKGAQTMADMDLLHTHRFARPDNSGKLKKWYLYGLGCVAMMGMTKYAFSQATGEVAELFANTSKALRWLLKL